MNKIIVDTNIVFSAFLNIDSKISQILINGFHQYEFYAPEYIRYEILEHQSKIKKLARLSDDEFIETYELVMRNIKVLNHKIVPFSVYEFAKKLCYEIDIDDTIFIAFTEFLEGKLWTGDKKLINGLEQKGYLNWVTTEVLYADFTRQTYKNR